MKKLFLSLVAIAITIATTINAQTLVPNQPSFLMSSSGTMPADPTQFFDGDTSTPYQGSDIVNFSGTDYYYGYPFFHATLQLNSGYLNNGSTLQVDLNKLKFIEEIRLKNLQSLTKQSVVFSYNSFAPKKRIPLTYSTNSQFIVSISTATTSIGPGS